MLCPLLIVADLARARRSLLSPDRNCAVGRGTAGTMGRRGGGGGWGARGRWRRCGFMTLGGVVFGKCLG